ncbi:methyl-accepting chemotaxis protein [Litoreibacter roseus]|uniref:methyl-accepting chemotaxis protein n=1 Tax=Litoreibacter roseus TaxID=2601869 RepID=UPI00135B43B6|nr:HAMP domain-containing methyl-accepting chemotaxis protein [Litoreibacter roseus]
MIYLFQSIGVKMLLIFAALATTSAFMFFVATTVFRETAENLETLTLVRLPELKASIDLDIAASRLKNGMIGLLLAQNSEELLDERDKKEKIINGLQTAYGLLDRRTKAQIGPWIVDVERQMTDLSDARLREFESLERISQSVSALWDAAETATAEIEKKVDDAYFDLAIGGEHTIEAVTQQLDVLVNDVLAHLHSVLAIQSNVNLISGVALALTQTTDPALEAILRDLRETGLKEVDRLVADHRNTDPIEGEFDALKKHLAIIRDQSDSNVLTRRQRTKEILAARRALDAFLIPIIDDLAFEVAISSEHASTENADAINALLAGPTAVQREASILQTTLWTFLATALETANASNPVELEIAGEKLRVISLRLDGLSQNSNPSLRKEIETLLAIVAPESGLSMLRGAVLATQEDAVEATEAAAKSVIAIGSLAQEFGRASQEKIFAASGVVLDHAGVAEERLRQIAMLSAALFLAAFFVNFTWIIKPLVRLTKTTENLASGDLTQPIGFRSSGGEIGRMANALRVFRDGLVEKNAIQAQVEQEREAHEQEQQAVVASLAKGLNGLANKDLNVALREKFPGSYDRLRHDFNAAVMTLKDIIDQIVTSGRSVRKSTSAISNASTDLSNRSENAAGSLQQTAAALEQITSSVASSSQQANATLDVVKRASKSAEQGKGVIDATVTAIQDIKGSSLKISEIVDTIDSIAFQTNLLALNAGVEAARANEAGRGFAVVASEVQALAQRSSEAAKDIKKLIDLSAVDVDRGVDLVALAENAFDDIATAIMQASAQTTEIAKASEDQALGITEINGAIGELDKVTQQNAAMLEQTSAAHLSLKEEAERLGQIVEGFTLDARDQDYNSLTDIKPQKVLRGIA